MLDNWSIYATVVQPIYATHLQSIYATNLYQMLFYND